MIQKEPFPEYSRPLIPVKEQDRWVFKVDENMDFKADKNDPVLVKKVTIDQSHSDSFDTFTKEKVTVWEPVTSIDKPVHRLETAGNYGLWRDQHVLKHQDLPSMDTEIVRLKNGAIEEDEIEPFSFFQETEAESEQYYCGTEIALHQSPAGATSFAFLHSLVYERNSDAELSEQEVKETINKTEGSEQWLVRFQPPPPPQQQSKPVKKDDDPPMFY
jgi:hypothetical protein